MFGYIFSSFRVILLSLDMKFQYRYQVSVSISSLSVDIKCKIELYSFGWIFPQYSSQNRTQYSGCIFLYHYGIYTLFISIITASSIRQYIVNCYRFTTVAMHACVLFLVAYKLDFQLGLHFRHNDKPTPEIVLFSLLRLVVLSTSEARYFLN